GENVSEYATIVADICQRLEAAHMLPREIVTILCNIFETSSNETFNSCFKNIFTGMYDPGTVKHTYSTVLEKAVRVYRQLKDSNRWLPTSKKQGAFSAEANSGLTQVGTTRKGEQKAIKCFNCGGPHDASACPKKGNKEKAGGLPPKGNANKKSWRKTQPKAGSTTQKTVDGLSYKWCAKCRRWTTTHSTEEHRDQRKNEDSRAFVADDVEYYGSEAALSMTG
ncbi:MAG: hypothetical protein ACREOZ_01475, partial [Gloeomargaritales cyanobacterium]